MHYGANPLILAMAPGSVHCFVRFACRVTRRYFFLVYSITGYETGFARHQSFLTYNVVFAKSYIGSSISV